MAPISREKYIFYFLNYYGWYLETFLFILLQVFLQEKVWAKKRVFAYGESVDLSIIAGPALQRGGPLQSTLRQSLDFDEINRSYSNREEELVEAESLLNETVAAQESRVPELLNKTVASKKNLRFCETTENVDFVAEIVIAEGEIEGFRYKIDGYQDKINRLRQLERH